MEPRDWLVNESQAWLREGLISEDQRRAILSRYEASSADGGQAASVLTWMAVLAAGIGGLVLVAWNWVSMAAASKILLSTGPMLGLYTASALAVRAGRDVRAARLALLAALFAGAVLLVTEDLAHIDPERTQTVLLWAAVLAATGLLVPSAVAAGVATIILGWSVMVAADSASSLWWFVAVWPMLALAVERDRNRWIASGVAVVFGVWTFVLVMSVWPNQAGLAGVAVVLVGAWFDALAHGPAARRPACARTTPALALTLLGLMFLLPSGSHRGTTDWHLVAGSPWPVVALISALVFGVATHARANGAWGSRPVLLSALVAVWVLAGFTMPAAVRASWWHQWMWTGLFGVATVLFGASAIREASSTRDVGQSALGALAILVFVVVRLVDARSLMGSGLLLLMAAVVLWWSGRAWARPVGRGGVA